MRGKLATFPTWAEAQEAKRLMEIVYGDDFFVAEIFGAAGIYSGSHEDGGRALTMRSLEIAADEIAYT